MTNHLDESTIDEFIYLITKVDKLRNDFYNNIDYLYRDNNLEKSKIQSIGKQIANICLNIDTKISKFKYKLHEQNIILYNERDPYKYSMLSKHDDIIQLKKYHDEVNLMINCFNSEIFDTKKYSEFSETIEYLDVKDKYFNQKQLIKNLSKKLKFFMNSENHKLIFKISDVLYNYDEGRDLDEMLDIYKDNMKIAEKYMIEIRTYQYLTKIENIMIKEIFKLENKINEYTHLYYKIY